ncbi:unnamed protein product [Diplocarpon coronariae]
MAGKAGRSVGDAPLALRGPLPWRPSLTLKLPSPVMDGLHGSGPRRASGASPTDLLMLITHEITAACRDKRGPGKT